MQEVPKALVEYTEEEQAAFPRLVALPDDFPANEEILTANQPPSPPPPK